MVEKQKLINEVISYLFDRLNGDEVMTLDEVAAMLGRSKRQIRNFMKDDDLPFSKADAKPWFLKSQVIKWIKSKQING